MGDLTDYAEDLIGDWIANNQNIDAIELNVQLVATDDSTPTDTDIDSDIMSKTGNQPCEVTNDEDISFGDPDFDKDIASVILRDRNDNEITEFNLSEPKQVVSDVDELRFKAGDLVFKIN